MSSSFQFQKPMLRKESLKEKNEENGTLGFFFQKRGMENPCSVFREGSAILLDVSILRVFSYLCVVKESSVGLFYSLKRARALWCLTLLDQNVDSAK
jgi:hypothetical protein